jgi:hypothetical protein
MFDSVGAGDGAVGTGEILPGRLSAPVRFDGFRELDSRRSVSFVGIGGGAWLLWSLGAGSSFNLIMKSIRAVLTRIAA